MTRPMARRISYPPRAVPMATYLDPPACRRCLAAWVTGLLVGGAAVGGVALVLGTVGLAILAGPK